jgi:hypothetical protein
MLDGIVVPIFQAIYTFVHFIATILWGLNQAMLLVGYYLMALTDWLINQAFSPLISQVTNQTSGLLAPIFTIAMLVLAVTYLLSVFGYIQIVEMRSAIMWLIFAAFVFQTGPSLYAGTEQFRRGIGGMFYESGFTTLNSESGSIEGLASVGVTSASAMDTPVNNFQPWLSFDQSIDGLDVALAYLYADGCDVLRASGCGDLGPLPFRWYLQPPADIGYFDNTQSGDMFRFMSNDERQVSLSQGADGIWRLFSGLTVSFFGMIEQLIHLVLAIAMGIAYLSLMIAVLFSFFKRTENITWSVFNLIIELFVQSIITSLMLSIVMTFVIIGAGTGNGILLLGSSFIGAVLLLLLFLGAVKAVWNAINRLIGAMGQASGGTLMNVTQSAGMVAGGTAQMASGSIGAAALVQRNGMNTDSAGQMVGMMFSGSRRMSQGAMYARQAFGEDSALGSFADNMFQGATASQLTGRAAAGFLLPGRNDEDETNDNRRPRRRKVYDEDGFLVRGPRSDGGDGHGSVETAPRLNDDFDNPDDNEPTPVTGSSQPVRVANGNPPAPNDNILFGDPLDNDMMQMIGHLFQGSQPSPPPREYTDADVPPDYDDDIPDIPQVNNLTNIPGIGAPRAQRLNAQGINTVDNLAQADAGEIAANIPGVSERMAQSWVNNAQERVDDTNPTIAQQAPISPSASQIASAVDAADNDDDVHLSADMSSAVSSQPVTTDSGNDVQIMTSGSTLQAEAPPTTVDTDIGETQKTTQSPVTQQQTSPSASQIASAVDFADNDDDARLSANMRSAMSSQPATTIDSGDDAQVVASDSILRAEYPTQATEIAPATSQSSDTQSAQQPETVPSVSQIAASVDAANNDDNARLVTSIQAANDATSTQSPAAPVDMSSLGNSIAQAVRTAMTHGANPSTAAFAGHIAQQSGVPQANVPEVGQFAQMANQMQLTPEQTSGVVQDVAQTGSIGPELANAIRSSLSTGSKGGQDINMGAAVSGLQQAATAMTTAVQSSAGGQPQSSGNTPANSGGQTASGGGDATFGKPPVSDGS